MSGISRKGVRTGLHVNGRSPMKQAERDRVEKALKGLVASSQPEPTEGSAPAAPHPGMNPKKAKTVEEIKAKVQFRPANGLPATAMTKTSAEGNDGPKD